MQPFNYPELGWLKLSTSSARPAVPRHLLRAGDLGESFSENTQRWASARLYIRS